MARLFARLIAWLLFRSPVEVLAGPTRLIFDPRSGRLYPAIAGAADDDADDDDSDDDSDDSDDDSDDEDESDDDASDDDDSDDDEDEKDKPSFLKRMSRRHERRAKAEKKRADRLQAELDKARGKKGKSDDGDDSDEEDELKERREALDEERRSFRLEQAVDRAARKGLKVEIDGKEKTVKFTDADDALAQIERQISRGDLDAGELFDDDGRVNREALEEALTDLAEDKPHLVGAAANGTRQKGKGDGGKGKGAAKSAEDLSIEELDKKVRSTK